MFGLYRTFLALWVVAAHLLVVQIGSYAVQAFFALSGYLMTYIMTKNYGYSVKGLRAFAMNRFLRLYPVYWALLLITTVAIMFIGSEQATAYRAVMSPPDTLGEWLANLSLIFPSLTPQDYSPRLVPPTWALTIELFYYALIALGLSKSKHLTVGWFALSLAYLAFTYFVPESLFDTSANMLRYGHILSGSLPFAAGAMIFHFSDQIEASGLFKTIYFHPYVLLSAWSANNLCSLGAVIYPSVLAWHSSVGMHLNLLLSCACLASFMLNGAPMFGRAADDRIGYFSYPFYLFHFPLGLIISSVLFDSVETRGVGYQGVVVLLTTVVASILLAMLLDFLIDRPIARLRHRIRQKAKLSAG